MAERPFGSTNLRQVPATPEILLGGNFPQKSMTVDRVFSGFAAYGLPDAAGDGLIKANSIYGRQTASPGKFAPFMFPNTVITDYTLGTPSLDVPNNEAAKLVAAGPSYTVFDDSAGNLPSGAADVFTIVSIGAADSGVGGAGFALITISAAITTTPEDGVDRIVLADGTQDPKNAVVVITEIDFGTTTGAIPWVEDPIEHGIYHGRLDQGFAVNFPPTAAQIAWFKDQNQRLNWDEPQL